MPPVAVQGGEDGKKEIMNTTYARQGTQQQPIIWTICWNGPGWYAGAEGQTIKLEIVASHYRNLRKD